MNRPVSSSIVNGCCVITVCNPPGNALNGEAMEGIISLLLNAEQDGSVHAIILTAAGLTFVTSEDPDDSPKSDLWRRRNERFHRLLYAIEDCRKPVVCAINGSASGEGLELALACHYRVAQKQAELCQPEIKLGLIPNGGATQRLPRLAGVVNAAAMCSSGDSVTAGAALKSGILDAITEGVVLTAALRFAANIVDRANPIRKTREITDKLGINAEEIAALTGLREQARRQYRGRTAPLKAIDAVEASTKVSFAEGCRRESELLVECISSEESGGLLHFDYAKRELARQPLGVERDRVMKVRHAAVVGAGNMGTGIAMAYANAGMPVLLKDESQELLGRGMEAIHDTYEISLKKGRITREEVRRCLGLIKPVTDYKAFTDADVVVEAVYEDLKLKRRIFREIGATCKPEAILATNTSGLDIDQIASAAPNPSRVVGHHFFAPANVMQLIEIVRGRETSTEVIAASILLARTLNKMAVVVRNCRGFAGNRMYYQYQREAQFLVEEGAEVQDVDAALYDFGMAMGPFATRDLSGLDMAWRAQKEYAEPGPPPMRSPLVLDRLYANGRFGQKSGAGWYRYPAGSREPQPDPEVQKIIIECAQHAGIRRRQISSAEIIERTLYALINEGARILGEGVAAKAAVLDVIFIAGYGFPAHRGGPMWFGDRVGLKSLCARLFEFERRFGDYWAPAPLLLQLEKTGKSFADFDALRSY